jgi:acyl carrier protein
VGEAVQAVPLEEEVAAEIIRALRAEFPQREITAATLLFDELALDSLMLMTLAVQLEDHYRIYLNETDADALRTVTDLAALVVRRIREQRS